MILFQNSCFPLRRFSKIPIRGFTNFAGFARWIFENASIDNWVPPWPALYLLRLAAAAVEPFDAFITMLRCNERVVKEGAWMSEVHLEKLLRAGSFRLSAAFPDRSPFEVLQGQGGEFLSELLEQRGADVPLA